MGRIVHRRLACGLELVVEPIEGVRSAGLNWFVPAGSATEPDALQGLGSMWSELLLRGAGDLDSRAQADAFDRVGATRSVQNGRFFATISSSMLGDRLGQALPLLADMVRRPRLDPDSIEPVRTLALQALASLEDDPQERAIYAAREHHYPSPVNRSGLGTEAGLNAITRDDLMDWWTRHAVPEGSILAIAGAVEPDAVASRLEELLAGWAGSAPVPTHSVEGERGSHHLRDDTNQVQIVVVHDAPPERDESAMRERLLGAVLSGGMSGRLFTEVRERRGLCYAVHSSYGASRDFGTVTAYVGTTPERAQESLDVLFQELARVGSAEGAVTRDEFDRAIVGMKANLVFSGESTAARASALASDVFKLGRPRSLDEIASAIDAISRDDLNAYAAGRSLGRPTIQTLGPTPLKPPGS